jgi:hypothetical protein
MAASESPEFGDEVHRFRIRATFSNAAEIVKDEKKDDEWQGADAEERG